MQDSKKSLPSYSLIVAKHVLWQLVKNIVKIVTYPIALIGLLLASLYGMIDPINGRAFIASIEDAWSRDTISEEDALCHHAFRFGEYMAICMQPKDVWDQKNIYHVAADYHPRSLRSLLRQIHTMLKDKKRFFRNEGINVNHLSHAIEIYRQTIQAVSLNAQDEKNSVTGDLKQTAPQIEIRDHLETILTRLEILEEERQQLVSEKKHQDRLSAHNWFLSESMRQIDVLFPQKHSADTTPPSA